MAIDRTQLLRHLRDYEVRTGNRTERFVCPITLRECDESELMNGHILNAGLHKASRRSVIQFGDVDHFYGSRVEPTLIRYLNLMTKSTVDLVRESRAFEVIFPDGSQVTAFFAGPEASERFPEREILLNGEVVVKAFLRVAKDDPRLSERPIELSLNHAFMPSHWVAAMLKSGYLAMFEMLGYGAVFDPFGDHIRRCLARYYFDGGTREDAAEYFRPFRNAVKLLLRKNVALSAAFDADTLDDRVVLLHSTPRGTVFAADCIFRMNDAIACVTLPQSTAGADVAVAVEFYERLMRDEKEVPQVVRRATFQDGQWQVLSQPLDIRYMD